MGGGRIGRACLERTGAKKGKRRKARTSAASPANWRDDTPPARRTAKCPPLEVEVQVRASTSEGDEGIRDVWAWVWLPPSEPAPAPARRPPIPPHPSPLPATSTVRPPPSFFQVSPAGARRSTPSACAGGGWGSRRRAMGARAGGARCRPGQPSPTRPPHSHGHRADSDPLARPDAAGCRGEPRWVAQRNQSLLAPPPPHQTPLTTPLRPASRTGDSSTSAMAPGRGGGSGVGLV